MEQSPLSGATRLGPVELRITNLQRSEDFYSRVIGLTVLARDKQSVTLGLSDQPLVIVHEHPGALAPRRRAGLYHFALLFAERHDLAQAAYRIAHSRTPIQGATDHGTHEAIYLPDPDGNGIELAWDRPRHEWPALGEAESGRLAMVPLDIYALLETVSDGPLQERVDGGLTIGHMHLHVSDLDAARKFYITGLGMEEQMAIPTAAFVSAAGYHHHVAFNTWHGEGCPPVDPSAIGLACWHLHMPSADFAAVQQRLASLGVGLTPESSSETGPRMRLADPSGNVVVVGTVWE